MIYIHKKIKNPIKDGIEIGEEIKRKCGKSIFNNIYNVNIRER